MKPSWRQRVSRAASGLDTPWKRAAFAMVLMMAVFAGALTATRFFGTAWRHYWIRPLGITIELPARPTCTVRAARPGDIAFECRTRHLAVLLAGQEFPKDKTPTAGEMLRRAMTAIGKNPEITGVHYQTLGADLHGRPALQVAGTLKRKGAPARLRGIVWIHGNAARQILVFFSDEKGAAGADRILRSLVPESEEAAGAG